MAGADLGAPRSAARGGKKHRAKKRMSVRLDMTPMVDVVMLLITFFMLTTVFNTPQTMEINLPPDEDATVEVAESNLLTLRVDKAGRIYWNMGVEKPQQVEFARLRPLLVERLAANPKLITLVKVDRESAYKTMVDVMDELNLASITRFSLAPFRDFDRELLAAAAPAPEGQG
jgi:biopolymer transport protein ExbD